MQCLTQQRICTNTPLPRTRMAGSWPAMGLASWFIFGLVLTLLLAPVFAQAKIYKTVDEDGNVAYSDVPPVNTEQRAESTIELEINNTYSAKESGPVPTQNPKGGGQSIKPGNTVGANSSPASTPPATTYQSITISAPAANANLRSNSGDVTLSISLQPSLRAGDQVRFFMDGKPVGTVNGTSLSLTNIDRGTHTLAAVVLDGAGKPRISSTTTSFSIQRYVPKRVSVN
jgi:hypothetical protein